MEAVRFGFDPSLPPAFRFDPTDADLVAFYLLPSALGMGNPFAHAVIDADPVSCPPWELLRRHGHADSDHAFFWGPPNDPVKNDRVVRMVPPGEPGGTWRGQKKEATQLFLRRGGGGVIELTFKKYNLTYCNDTDDKKSRSSGWVIHEYQIIEPPLPSGAVLARVKITDRANKVRRENKRRLNAAEMSSVPYQDQPGPSGSNYYYHNEEAGTSAQAFVAPPESDYVGDDTGEPGVNYTELLNSGEENNNYVMDAYYFNQGYDGAGDSNYGGGTHGNYDDARDE